MAVAMIGRPNVGKSSLFNRLIGRRRAIVWNQPGVTRDLIRDKWENGEGKEIELWDLAGLGGDGRSIAKLSKKELAEIDLFIHVVDGSEPLTSDDRECFERARRLNKPIVVVLNKCDKTTFQEYSHEIFEYSPLHVFEISAEQKRGIGDLEDKVFELLKSKSITTKVEVEVEGEEGVEKRPRNRKQRDEKSRRIFILGRPNVGKSSLVNQLVGEEIAMVANQPGTTRDRILGSVDHAGLTWEFLDTAGVRKKPKLYGRKADPLEIFSVETAMHRMDEADYVIFVVEAQASGQLTTQDKKLLNLIRDKLLPTLIVVNKWDLYRKEWSEKDYRGLLKDQLGDLAYLPSLFISAKTGFQVKKIFQIFKDLDRCFKTIPTSKLNKWLQNILETKPPRIARKGVKAEHFRSRTQYLKFYYMVQTSLRPMGFQIFCNAPQAVAEEDRKFFVNNLRSEFKLQGIPFRFTFRSK